MRYFGRGVLIGLALVIAAWSAYNYFGDTGNIAIGKDAVIIPGECIVINYDASIETWDKAKAAWLVSLEKYGK